MYDARVLIVEDEAITSINIQTELKNLGYKVAGVAFNGREALKIASQQHPDVCLMDINLPGKLDGIQTALLLKEVHALPVIFVTALVDDGTIERAKPVQPSGYIIKPFKPEDLSTTIELAMYRRQMEEKNRLNEARYRGLFDTSLDGIVSADLDGFILECNPAIAGMLGYSIAELTGMSIETLAPAEYLPNRSRNTDGSPFEPQFLENLIIELLRKDGSRIPVNLKIWTRPGADRSPVGYWAIIRDMTQQKQASLQIQRQAEYSRKLIELTALLNQQVSLPDLYQMICAEMLRIMDVDLTLIARYEGVDSIQYVYWRGIPALQAASLDAFALRCQYSLASSGENYRYIRDIQQDQNSGLCAEEERQLDFRSVMMIQLIVESKIIGALTLGAVGRERVFSDDEVRFLLAFANQVAVALDRARLFEQVRSRVNELEALARMSVILRPLSKPVDMLPILLSNAVELADADCGVIYLLGLAGNLVSRYEHSMAGCSLGDMVHSNSRLWARALSSEGPVFVSLDADHTEDAASADQEPRPLTSLVMLSLRSAQTISAVMGLAFSSGRDPKPDKDRVLSSLAELGGNALHRCGLMETLEKRATSRSSELRTLYDLSVLFNSLVGYEEKLSSALATCTGVVNARYSCLYSYDPANQSLLLETHHNLPVGMLEQAYEVKLADELKTWLETSSVPWLVHHGSGLSSLTPIVDEAGYQTIINLPVRFESETLGLLSIIWQKRTELAPENIALLIAITERIGSLMHNERTRQDAELAALLEERQRLAREFHDSVTQTLYSVTLLAEAGKDLLARRELDRLQDCLDRLGENSLQALREMRLLLFELRGTPMGDKDLADALQTRLDMVERRSGIQASLDIQGSLGEQGSLPLSASQQENLYRIAIEALNNSLKHAGARSVRVRLNADPSRLRLSIEDDGKGIDEGQRRSVGMGMTSMEERARQIGAVLQIQSTPDSGTRVIVEIKLDGEVSSQ